MEGRLGESIWQLREGGEKSFQGSFWELKVHLVIEVHRPSGILGTPAEAPLALSPLQEIMKYR